MSHSAMYIISKMWIDPLENQFGTAFGYRQIGFVLTLDEAERICNSVFIDRATHPWPLDFVDGQGPIPKYKYKLFKLQDISHLSLEQLQNESL